MRNLKKLLSVVLVVAMIAGLCAVGSFSAAAAEYSEVTNYKEAAAVVSGIGIINGYEDGTMQYDKAVTREEAAKIICVALIGSDTVANLKTAVAPFDDVAANRWSAPYISYLKAQGIVAGKSATKFDPTAEVTAVEFAKMMLCAAGYGKAGEFVGASWDVNTIATANTYGVFDKTLATDLTAPATREQCMLYTFNAITRVPTVSYNSTFNSYYTGTSVMNGSGSKVADANIGKAADNDYKTTLAYTKFKLIKNPATDADEYGRPAAVWQTEGGKKLTDAVATETPAAVINNAVGSMTLTQNLPADVISNLNKYITTAGKALTVATQNTDKRILYFVDGVQTPIDGTQDFLYPQFAYIKSNEMFANPLASAGAITELYVDTNASGDYKLTIVVVNQYLAKVTKVDAAAKKLYLTVYNSVKYGGTAANYTDCVVDGEKINISGFAKNDYVLVTLENNKAALANGSNVTSIVKANTSVGTFTETDSFDFYIIDGQHLQATSKIMSSAITYDPTKFSSTLNIEIGNTYTFYYDTLGNIAYFELYDEAETGTANYLFVPAGKSAAADDNWAENVKAYAQIRGVFPAGGYKDYNLAVKVDGTRNYVTITNGTVVTRYYLDTAGDITAFNGAVQGNFFAYTTNDDGTVNLKVLNTKVANQGAVSAAPNNTISKGLASVTGVAAGYTANSKTVLTVINESGEAKTYTGISNFPNLTLTANAPVLYTYANNSKTIKALCYVDNAAAVADQNLAYCAGKAKEDSTGITYNFYVDGETKSVLFDAGTSLNKGSIYDLQLSTSGNTATLVDYGTGTGKYVVNATAVATPTDLKSLGKFNFASLGYDYYYAWATIKTVDTNVFTTENADSFDPAIYGATVNDANGATITSIGSHTYYYDNNTKIYDCRAYTGNGVKAELSEGAAFIAHVDEASGGTYNGVQYCDYIWIVG